MTQPLHLRAAGVSLVLGLSGATLPRVLHWGSNLGAMTDHQLEDLRLALRQQPIGFSVDGPVEVSLLPEQSQGWLGSPGLPSWDQGGVELSGRILGAVGLQSPAMPPEHLVLVRARRTEGVTRT